MTKQWNITLDQQQSIENILSRIREGLSKYPANVTEPAHIYAPERFDDGKM